MNRRNLLTGMGALATIGVGGKLTYEWNERSLRAEVFIAKAATYEADLESIIGLGLRELGLSPAWAKGRSVLLKPNLVEPCLGAPQINTHPAVVRAAAEVFRRWGAREVIVAEGPGHCRDAQLVLDQSGLGDVLDQSGLEFVDLNHDDVSLVPNRFGATSLAQLALPATLKRADLIVSLPKMKTHHWAGVTLSLKNFFGVMPGIFYGWPKNVLHHAGIGRSILDIAAAVRPHLAIVDGIIGMEGDGPIMGTPRHAGVLVMGTNLPAVDATCCTTDGDQPLADRLSGGGIGPARAHRRAAHRTARRVDRVDEAAVPVARSSVISGLENVKTQPKQLLDPLLSASLTKLLERVEQHRTKPGIDPGLIEHPRDVLAKAFVGEADDPVSATAQGERTREIVKHLRDLDGHGVVATSHGP